jgi:FkbM family methyltransferase
MKLRKRIVWELREFFRADRAARADVRRALARDVVGRAPSGEHLTDETRLDNLVRLVEGLAPALRQEVLAQSGYSRSQLLQDLFVLSELGTRPGFFVEFGATDGVRLSNTWLLEKRLGWKGILAEPAKCWHQRLKANRSCLIEHDCVWRASGERLPFLETPDAELATLADYRSVDAHAKSRQSAKAYEVTTVSLSDLMERHQAPANPDYLSIDTEGSEFEILQTFNFSKYPFKVITCEHNFTPAREKIHGLLTCAGYVRKHQEISAFDDWYIRG